MVVANLASARPLPFHAPSIASIFEANQSTQLTTLIIKQGKLGLVQATRMASQICDELNLFHNSGLVHTNIEPDKIWLTGDGQVEIERQTTEIFSYEGDKGYNTKSTNIHTFDNTKCNLYYMSPELGQVNSNISAASDIYSLGTTLYAAITGHHYLPFKIPQDQNDYLNLNYNYQLVRTRKQQSSKYYNPFVPATLEAVLLHCLEKNAADRYQSASEVQQVLYRIIIQLEERSAKLYVEGVVAQTVGKLQKALALYNEVLAIDTNHAEAIEQRTKVERKLNLKNPDFGLTLAETDISKPGSNLEVQFPVSVTDPLEQLTIQTPEISYNLKNEVSRNKSARLTSQVNQHWLLSGLFALVILTLGILLSAQENNSLAEQLPTSTLPARQTSLATTYAPVVLTTVPVNPTNTLIPTNPASVTVFLKKQLERNGGNPITILPFPTSTLFPKQAASTFTVLPIPTTVTSGVATGNFLWPLTGVITTYFSRSHPGLDIAAPCGTIAKAADGGMVVESGWSNYGYGFTVLIDHGKGTQTRYAHFAKLAVLKGQTVARGDTVGYEGSTGNSTGCHVHFELIVNGVWINPINVLQH